jgi:hypothetical protein
MNVAKRVTSSRAAAEPTLGASRASTRKVRHPRSRTIEPPVGRICATIVAGTQMPMSSPGMEPWNVDGATPITVNRYPLMRTTSPITALSPCHRLRHNP